jgi:hypothetical protein
MSGNVPGAKRIVAAAKAFMPDDPEFEDAMCRSNIGVVCFKNGVYDFRKRAFFDYSDRPDVFPKVVVPRDFPRDRPPQHLMDEVRDRLLLSTLVCPDVVETYLQLMARATAGEYADNNQNGKGLLKEMHANAWGPYVNTIKFPFVGAADDMLGDDSLKTDFCRRPDVIDAFTWLILDAYRDHPVVPCASVQDTGSYREDIADDLVVMTRCFKITKNRDDFVTFKDLKAFLAGKNVTTTVAKDRLKKMGAWPDDNCCVKGIRYGRGIRGVQMIHERAEAPP